MCIRHCRDWGTSSYAAWLRLYLDQTGDIDSVIEALALADERGEEHLEYFFLDQMTGLQPEHFERIAALGYKDYIG